MNNRFLAQCPNCGEDTEISPPSNFVDTFVDTCQHCGKRVRFNRDNITQFTEDNTKNNMIQYDKNGKRIDEAKKQSAGTVRRDKAFKTFESPNKIQTSEKPPFIPKSKRLAPRSLKPLIAGCLLFFIFLSTVSMALLGPQNSIDTILSRQGKTTFRGKLVGENTEPITDFQTEIVFSQKNQNFDIQKNGSFSLNISYGFHEGIIIGKGGYLNQTIRLFSIPFINQEKSEIHFEKNVTVYTNKAIKSDNLNDCPAYKTLGKFESIKTLNFDEKKANFSVWLQHAKKHNVYWRANMSSSDGNNWTKRDAFKNIKGMLNTSQHNNSIRATLLKDLQKNYPNHTMIIGFWGESEKSAIKKVFVKKDGNNRGRYISNFDNVNPKITTLEPSPHILYATYKHIDLLTYPSLVFASIALIGGVFAFLRKNYVITKIGSIAGVFSLSFLLSPILSIIAFILILLSKNEFK